MMRRRQRLAVAAAEVVVNLTVCFVEADQGDCRPGGGKAAALRLAMASPSPPIPSRRLTSLGRSATTTGNEVTRLRQP